MRAGARRRPARRSHAMNRGTRCLMLTALASLGLARSGSALDYRTYENPHLGVTLSVPQEWETREDPDGTVTISGSTGVLVVSARPRSGCTPQNLRQHAARYV